MPSYTIESKTILLPHIIAEGAFWDEIENLPVSENPEKALELQNKVVPALVIKANYLYKHNKHFRSRITSTEKGRNTLWAFMRHWTKGILKVELLNIKP